MQKEKNIKVISYYLIATLFPSLFVILLVTVYSIITNHDYKSEWFTSGTVIMMEVLFSFFYCIIISAFFSSILFIRAKFIRENKYFTEMLFLGFPLIVLLFLSLVQIMNDIHHDNGIKNLPYMLMIHIPFLFGLAISYLKYRKDIRKK